MTPAQQLILNKLRDGWQIVWDRSGEDNWGYNCAAWRDGRVCRVHPLALRALERVGKISWDDDLVRVVRLAEVP